jgi:hypothetical protein
MPRAASAIPYMLASAKETKIDIAIQRTGIIVDL